MDPTGMEVDTAAFDPQHSIQRESIDRNFEDGPKSASSDRYLTLHNGQ